MSIIFFRYYIKLDLIFLFIQRCLANRCLRLKLIFRASTKWKRDLFIQKGDDRKGNNNSKSFEGSSCRICFDKYHELIIRSPATKPGLLLPDSSSERYQPLTRCQMPGILLHCFLTPRAWCIRGQRGSELNCECHPAGTQCCNTATCTRDSDIVSVVGTGADWSRIEQTWKH